MKRIKIDMAMYSHLRPEDVKISEHPLRPRHGMLVGTISVGVLVEHKPTGLHVVCSKYSAQYLNKDEALATLNDLVKELENTNDDV